MRRRTNPFAGLPDVRDGLTELERVTLYVMYEARKEYGDRMIPTVLLWGRVCEYVDVSMEDFQLVLSSASEKRDRYGIAPDVIDPELPDGAE